MIFFPTKSTFSAEFVPETGMKGVFSSDSQSLAAGFDDVVPLDKTTNYNSLTHKPSVNGVELSGDKTAEDLQIVSENTTAGWNSMPQYIPKRGEICIYTDYETIQDEQGNDIVCPGVKIGDGNAYLIDMPFAGAETRYKLLEHKENATIHVSQQDRSFWNNKINCDVSGEELIFTRN